VRRKFAKYAARCPARIRAATSRWKKIQLYGGGGGGGGGGSIVCDTLKISGKIHYRRPRARSRDSSILQPEFMADHRRHCYYYYIIVCNMTV